MQAKICGIKTIEAALTAAENGATMIGLNFYPPSPRFISQEAAQQLVETLQNLPIERRPKTVGLFVNVPVEELTGTADYLKLDYLQLSGDETPEFCQQATRVRPVLKAVRLLDGIGEADALKIVEPFGNIENVTLLLDTPKQGFYGGTGETGNWKAARAVAQNYRTMLAGGLTPKNVADAINLVQPWGVDVSSGVEVEGKPGEKDLVKIKKFLAQVKKVGSE